MSGKFIVIEGGEGAGKGTQIKKLKELLGDKIVCTREPGGSVYAEEIRNLILHSPNASQADAKTLFALFWASRADHLKNTIIPALQADKVVVCDRFDASSFAYQLFGQMEDESLRAEFMSFFWTTRDFYLGETKPDLYLYLDLPTEVGLARKQQQQQNGQEILNHFDQQTLAFHDRKHQGFMEFFRAVPHQIIDANRPVDEVFAELKTLIEKMV